MTLQNTNGQLASRAVKDVYPVSRLVREVRVLLEGSFTLLWVEGEISNLAMPASGHIYFSLKDQAAQVRCAMFRNRNQRLSFTPENGMQVLLRVRVTMYENRGEFQLIVEHMEEAGSGALQRAYEALKQRLGQEGLFDEKNKQPLPSLPKTIGIISSPDGAAVHDILSVLNRRFPAVNVILYPVAVQGEASAMQLLQAVNLANQRNECDVLIIGRGGGSLEDLWSFNDEKLARAIFESALPVISAVGHEIDFTIADFVADVRAPTPSAAAEIAVIDQQQIVSRTTELMQRLSVKMQHVLNVEQQHLNHIQRRLPKPELMIKQQQQMLNQIRRVLNNNWQRIWLAEQQKLDYLAARLKHPKAQIDGQKQLIHKLGMRFNVAIQSQHRQHKQSLMQLETRLRRQIPEQQLSQQQHRIVKLDKQLTRAIFQHLELADKRLSEQVRTLAAVSPLNTLERGYSITRMSDKTVITQATDDLVGKQLEVHLHQGQLLCEVKGVKH